MGRDRNLERRTVVAAEVAAPTRTPAFAHAYAGLSYRKGLVRQEIAETRCAHDENARAYRLRLEILHDERAVVVSKKADMVSGVEADEQVAAQNSADLIKDAPGQAVEIGEVIGDSQGVESAPAVLSRDDHRIPRGGRRKGDGCPGIVFEMSHLRQHDVQVRF